MTRPPRSEEGGFTLVEFAIVAAMSALIVFTLATFYINAQHMWIDSSLQAVTQRDASLFVDVMADHAAVADSASLTDSSHLYLWRKSLPSASVTWEPGSANARLTEFDPVTGLETSVTDWPATGGIVSLRFRKPAGTQRIVMLDSLIVTTSPGERVFFATALPLSGRP